MAASIYDLSVTAASNTTIDGTDVSGATGKVKDGDNVMRSLGAYAAQKVVQDDGGTKTTAGSANAQTVTLASGFTALSAGMSCRVKIGSGLTNTSTTVTLNVNSIASTRVKVNYGGVLADPIPGDLQAGAFCRFVYDGTYWVLQDGQAQGRYSPGTLYGLTLSNNAGTPASKLDIAVGSCRDSSDAANMDLLSALTAKDLATAWAVGSSAGMLATGASVANGTYHIFLIKRPDTGIVDVAADTSVTGANIAANTNAAYTLKRRIGSIIRSGGNILLFVQNGDVFMHNNASTEGINDVNAGTTGTSAVTRTLTVPTGITVDAIINLGAINGTAGAVQTTATQLDLTDVGPASIAQGVFCYAPANLVIVAGGRVKTNTSAQIRTRADTSSASITQLLSTLGWVDTRGRI